VFLRIKFVQLNQTARGGTGMKKYFFLLLVTLLLTLISSPTFANFEEWVINQERRANDNNSGKKPAVDQLPREVLPENTRREFF
jgi:hypothetical protein